jgi:hypothetical protein
MSQTGTVAHYRPATLSSGLRSTVQGAIEKVDQDEEIIILYPPNLDIQARRG